MGDELKWLLKEEGGCIFESCDISLENTPTSHAVSLALVICTCSDSAMPLLSCACLCNNSNGAYLPSCSFFSASCLTQQHVLRHKWVGVLSREKHPLQQLHLKRRVGIFSRFMVLIIWPPHKQLVYVLMQYLFCQARAHEQ